MEENDPRLAAVWRALRSAEKENPLSNYAFGTRVLAGLNSIRKQSPFLLWAGRLAPVFLLGLVLLAWSLPEEIRQFEETAAFFLANDSSLILETTTGNNL